MAYIEARLHPEHVQNLTGHGKPTQLDGKITIYLTPPDTMIQWPGKNGDWVVESIGQDEIKLRAMQKKEILVISRKYVTGYKVQWAE